MTTSRPDAVESRVDRLAELIGVGAFAWFALAAGWGLGGKLGAGHYAAMTSEGIMADNMFRWGIAAPVWNYSVEPPLPANWYCNHPWGLFWITAALFKLFGHRELILPLPAVIMSALTVVLLFQIARDAWGKVPAATAACAFVLLPITLGFANFHSLEVMVMFGWCLYFRGTQLLLRTGKIQHLALSLVGVLVATFADWPAWIAIAVVLLFGLVRLKLFPARWLPPAPPRRMMQAWIAPLLVALASLAFWILLFGHAGKLSQLFAAGQHRAETGGATVLDAVAARKPWIDAAFTPLVVTVGKLALPVALARLLWLKRDEELFSIAVWTAAIVQYVVFKNGADIHFFWPHYFGLYYALAVAQLTATLQLALSDGLGHWPGWSPKTRWLGTHAPALALAIGLLPSVLLIPDALWAIRYARETGGRFNEKGRFIRTDQDLVEVVSWLRPRLPAGSFLERPGGLAWGWHAEWQLRGPSRSTGALPSRASAATAPLWLTRTSDLDETRLRAVAGTSLVQAIGDLWVVDVREPPGPLEGFALREREPRAAEWLWLGGVAPVVRIQPDHWTALDWRLHLGQPLPESHDAPSTLEQLRIAYNLARSTGDNAGATALRAQLDQALDRSIRAPQWRGAKLIGVRRTGQAQPRLEAWLESTGSTAAPMKLGVQASVEAPARWSLMPADPTPRNCAPPPSIPTTMWKPGFLYRIEFPLFHRRGREVYTASWIAASATPANHNDNATTVLAVVE